MVKSILITINAPLHDFDGANRAEGAKQMKLRHEYLVPLTGSPYLRNEDLKLKINDSPITYLYYHLERPPFIYWLMIISTTIFGNNEFGYRLPSFIFGLSTILALFILITKTQKKNYAPLFVALTVLITSSDLWLSSQQALLDTGLTFFLFLAVSSLYLFQTKNKEFYLYLTGIFIALAVLCKGQPTAIIIFPILFFLMVKTINLRQVLLIVGSCLLVLAPWILAVCAKFGIHNFINTFILGFTGSRLIVSDVSQQAPFFWYLRWWLDSFRPGLIMFFAVLTLDIKFRLLTKNKLMLLVYIFGGLILFSVAKNKVWWYVLPLIPVIGLYVYLSLETLFEKKIMSLDKISLLLILSSLPIFYQTRSTVTFIYGFGILILCLLLTRIKKLDSNHSLLFAISITFSLLLFLFHFPVVKPTYPEIKNIASYMNKFPGTKCLYIKNMPYEAALFYSIPDTVSYFSSIDSLSTVCENYLITPDTEYRFTLVYQNERLKLYKIEK